MQGSREERIAELDRMFPEWKPCTIWERFQTCASLYPSADFIVCGDRRFTYSEANTFIRGVAAGLSRLGVCPGTKVVVRCGNRPEYLFSALALAFLGAVKVMANASSSGREVELIARVTGASYLVTDSSARVDATECPSLKLAVCLYGASIEGIRCVSWDDMLREPMLHHEGETMDAAPQDPDGVSDIMFTSGSTGHPKAVPLRHDQLLRSAFANVRNRGFEQNRKIMLLVPFSHCYGYVEGFLASLFVGACLVICPGKLDARKCVELIVREQVNDMLAMPYTMIKMVDYLKTRPCAMPSLHAVYCSGERPPEWLYGAIAKYAGVDDIVNGYGMTEICGAAMQTVAGDGAYRFTQRVGKILPAGCAGAPAFNGSLVEYRVMDRRTGKACACGQIGELEARGVTLTTGYLPDGGKGASPFLHDGWFPTGDVGKFDEDGYLELMGRSKDMYRINGENVSPEFVADVVQSFPDVKRAAVIGVPDERLGQVGCLFVQLDDDADQGASRLKGFLAANLARFQRPKYTVFMGDEDWVLTTSGKIDRRALSRSFLAGKFDGQMTAQTFSKAS